MEQRHVLGIRKLTLQDLRDIHLGVSLTADPDMLANELSPSTGGGVRVDSIEGPKDPFMRAVAAVRIAALLRGGQAVRRELIEQLLAELNSTDFQASSLQHVASRVSFTSKELQIFVQPKAQVLVPLAVLVAELKLHLEVLVAAFALTMECESVNASIADVKFYPKASSGTKAVLSDLESLLQNSKAAKKRTDVGAEFLEYPQLLGYLKDTLGDVGVFIEKELNAKESLDLKLQLPSLTVPLVSQLLTLASVLAEVNSLQKVRLSREPESYSLPQLSRDLEFWRAEAHRLHAFAVSIIDQGFAELLRNSTDLLSKEQKMNEGSAKLKCIPVGKGSRRVLQLVKETDSPQRLTEEIVSLLSAKNAERRVPKLAKGTRDYGASQMNVREWVFDVIKGVFRRHRAGGLDTPVMELKETLVGKYGDEGDKLIYDLADQGGEQLSLRYDLTVPFARYVAMNRISSLKRYHIAKVYRRDQPQMARGRYREFYQCDFDVVGRGADMTQEAEVLKIVSEALIELGIPFVIKFSHRQLLDLLLQKAGLPAHKFKTVCSSIDKLDKEPWETVRSEILEKGVSQPVVDNIGQLVRLSGEPRQVIQQLREYMAESAEGMKLLDSIEQLAKLSELMEYSAYLEFDVSLARGLDYYTGLVYEAVLTDKTYGVGSIAGGGRYDELIMRLNSSKIPIPAVGVSLGVERIFTIVEKQARQAIHKGPAVLVAQAGRSSKFDLQGERWKICNALWKANLQAETSYKEKSDPEGQSGFAANNDIPWVIFIGETELEGGVAKVRNMAAHSEQEVALSELAQYILANS
jgi:histidyl-tRNA synthetase